MMNPLEAMLPSLGESEYVICQSIKVSGDTMTIPLHVFNGDGKSVEVEASFSIEEADDVTMRAALSLAIEDAREKLA